MINEMFQQWSMVYREMDLLVQVEFLNPDFCLLSDLQEEINFSKTVNGVY